MNTIKQIQLHSSYGEVEKVEEFLNDLQGQLNFTNEDYARMMLTVSEAVTNGIVHGNKLVQEKVVTLTAYLENKSLFFECSDQGEGFDPTEVEDPLAEENLLKPSGRGVFLMKEYADDMSYNKSDRTLRLRFDLQL